jgi:hypothetical protein
MIASVVFGWWWVQVDHAEPPRWFLWATFGWTLAGLSGLLWMSLLGYRDPDTNRVTRWFSTAWLAWAREPEDSQQFVREMMLQTLVISAILLALLLVVAVREVLV